MNKDELYSGTEFGEYSAGLQDLLKYGGKGLKIRSQKLKPIATSGGIKRQFGGLRGFEPTLENRKEYTSVQRSIQSEDLDEDEDFNTETPSRTNTRVPKNTIPVNKTPIPRKSRQEIGTLPDIDMDRLSSAKASKKATENPYSLTDVKQFARSLKISLPGKSKGELVNEIRQRYV